MVGSWMIDRGLGRVGIVGGQCLIGDDPVLVADRLLDGLQLLQGRFPGRLVQPLGVICQVLLKGDAQRLDQHLRFRFLSGREVRVNVDARVDGGPLLRQQFAHRLPLRRVPVVTGEVGDLPLQLIRHQLPHLAGDQQAEPVLHHTDGRRLEGGHRLSEVRQHVSVHLVGGRHQGHFGERQLAQNGVHHRLPVGFALHHNFQVGVAADKFAKSTMCLQRFLQSGEQFLLQMKHRLNVRLQAVIVGHGEVGGEQLVQEGSALFRVGLLCDENTVSYIGDVLSTRKVGIGAQVKGGTDARVGVGVDVEVLPVGRFCGVTSWLPLQNGPVAEKAVNCLHQRRHASLLNGGAVEAVGVNGGHRADDIIAGVEGVEEGLVDLLQHQLLAKAKPIFFGGQAVRQN
ncbi:hypothetical protein TYRP_013406 [Tyrophagus putrescentiae]|nr:hypothetical protein TYRP_013406 [Tyrophagus putrescentiae]